MLSKYIINIFKYIFFIVALTFVSLPANSELSIEEIIKGRKALFSKNYSTAKKVQAFASKGELEKAKREAEVLRNKLAVFVQNKKIYVLKFDLKKNLKHPKTG